MRFKPVGQCVVALLASIAILPAGVRAADDPLAYVPGNAAVFIHLRAGDIWNGTVVKEARQSLGKELDGYLALAKEFIGISPELADTVTFLYPNMPQGPGDERTFVVAVTTTKPYDRATLLKKIWKKDATPGKDRVELEEKFVLYYASDTMFLVMHDSLVGKFAKSPVVDTKEGVMSDAIKLARDKHHFVLSQDFSKLPNEIFTAAPPELQPFLPLLKTRTALMFADLKEKNLDVGVKFQGTDVNATEDAERSFKLLMKLATDGLADVLKDEKVVKELGDFLPGLKELERGLKEVKIIRNDTRLDATMALKVDLPITKMVAQVVKYVNAGSGQAESTNNLKQIGLALHSYHDTHNGLPPAAIVDKKGKPLLSWRVAILPYLEQNALYQEFKLDEPWDSDHNKKLIAKMPRIYALPAAKADGKTHFRAFYGNGAAFDLIQQVRLSDFTDGTSNTAIVMEFADPIEWTKPDDSEFDDKIQIEKLLRFVNGVTPTVFADGSVRMIKKGKEEKVWRWIVQRNDGNPLPDLE